MFVVAICSHCSFGLPDEHSDPFGVIPIGRIPGGKCLREKWPARRRRKHGKCVLQIVMCRLIRLACQGSPQEIQSSSQTWAITGILCVVLQASMWTLARHTHTTCPTLRPALRSHASCVYMCPFFPTCLQEDLNNTSSVLTFVLLSFLPSFLPARLPA
jgi:hypothetical protein